MQFPTGGTAHEPQGMTRCDSGADSIVWMEEDRVNAGDLLPLRPWGFALECVMRSGVFFLLRGRECRAVLPLGCRFMQDALNHPFKASFLFPGGNP